MTSIDVAFPPPWAVFLASQPNEAMVDALCADLAAENGVEVALAVRSYMVQLASVLREERIDALAALIAGAEPAGVGEPPNPALAVAVVGTVALTDSPDLTEKLLGAAQLETRAAIETTSDMTELAGRPAARCSVLRHAVELRDSDGFAPLTWEMRYAIPIAVDRAARLRFITPSVGYLDEFAEMFDAIAASVVIWPDPAAEPEHAPAAHEAG